MCFVAFHFHFHWKLFGQYETMNVLCVCGFTSEALVFCCKSSAISICMSNFWSLAFSMSRDWYRIKHLVFRKIIYILLFFSDLPSTRTALVTIWRNLFGLWTDHALMCTPCYVCTSFNELGVRIHTDCSPVTGG